MMKYNINRKAVSPLLLDGRAVRMCRNVTHASGFYPQPIKQNKNKKFKDAR